MRDSAVTAAALAEGQRCVRSMRGMRAAAAHQSSPLRNSRSPGSRLRAREAAVEGRSSVNALTLRFETLKNAFTP